MLKALVSKPSAIKKDLGQTMPSKNRKRGRKKSGVAVASPGDVSYLHPVEDVEVDNRQLLAAGMSRQGLIITMLR